MPEHDHELTVTDSTGDLARRALGVLDANRRGAWTCPSTDLYPHQWLWDSCFVAIGLARHDPARAADELRALFRGQWSNGMVPHMVFAEGVRDVGATRIWRSLSNPLAPRDVETSCITQPPVLAIAVSRVAEALPAPSRAAFVAEMLPKLVAHHEWLYRERDPDGRGLVTLLHPWECGLDTTPPWMAAIARMPKPWWARAVAGLHLARLLRFLRRDTKYVPTIQRPSDRDGLGMLVLIHLAADHDFEVRRMPRDRSVLIEDVAFNSILAAANRALDSLAAAAGVAIPDPLRACFDRTRRAFEELWDEETREYCSRDTVTGTLLRSPTVATFLPLYAGVVPPARTALLVDRLHEPSGFWPRFPVPTVPTDAEHFREQRYWKGPTWVNTNWLVVEGLVHAGETERAALLRDRTIDLVDRSGCWEYFSPLTGEGYGAPAFSWTAALTLDLLAQAAAPQGDAVQSEYYDGVVLAEVAERVVTITLNRPESRNAMNAALSRGMYDAIADAGDDPDVDVVILTGADPAFCAGVDLKELSGDRPPPPPSAGLAPLPGRDTNGLHRFFPVIEKPVIGAINGVAVTGGFEVALQCTFLVASERARFADTHSRVGIMPGGGITVLMAQSIGLRRAIELSITGNFVDAAEAHRLGLVNHVVPHEELLPFTRKLATDVVSNDQRGVRRLLENYRAIANAATLDEAHLLEGYMAEMWLKDGIGMTSSRRESVMERGREQQG